MRQIIDCPSVRPSPINLLTLGCEIIARGSVLMVKAAKMWKWQWKRRRRKRLFLVEVEAEAVKANFVEAEVEAVKIYNIHDYRKN